MAPSVVFRLLFLLALLPLVACTSAPLLVVEVNNVPALADSLYVRVGTEDRVAPEYPRHELRELLTGLPFSYRFGVQPVGASGRFSVAVAIYDLKGCLMTAGAGEIELAAASMEAAPKLPISLPPPPPDYDTPCAQPDPSRIVLRSFQQQEADPTKFTLTGWGFSPGVSVQLDGQPVPGVRRIDLTRIEGSLPLTRSPSGLWKSLLEVRNPDGVSATQTVSIYSLTFSAQGNSYGFPADYEPRALRMADFDRDGKPDLVVAGHAASGGFLAAFQNQGNGRFAGPFLTSIPIAADYLELQDLTGDSLLDASVTSAKDQHLTTFPGASTGLFSTANSSGIVLTGKQPGSLVIGDFFGDNKPDLIFSFLSLVPPDGTHLLMLENVDGQLTPRFEILFEGDVHELAAVDLNKDGILDLVVTGLQIINFSRQGSIWPLLHTSRLASAWTVPSSTYTPRTNSPAFTLDYNLDGYPDLIGTGVDSSFADTPKNTIGLIPNQGGMRPGTFPKMGTTITAAADTYAMAAADLNQDGVVDLAVASSSSASENRLSVLLHQGSASSPFFASTAQPTYGLGCYGSTKLVPGDFDGDGRTDVAVLCAGAAPLSQPALLSVFLNTSPRPGMD